jgi:DNA-binding response OmpR family regulator
MKKILLIEDDVAVETMYREILHMYNYDVDSVEDGAEAMKMVFANQYDFLIVDLMIPNVSGVDVIRSIRAEEGPNNKSIIIAFTNMTEDVALKNELDRLCEKNLLKINTTPSQLVDIIESLATATPSTETK